MNAIEQSFDFEGWSVRTLTIDGEPWFVAQDVASILEYSATSAMTRRLADEDKGVRDLHTLGGSQQFTIISEAGLYGAIFGSRALGAQAFKRMVTHEILPAIRRTGSYGTPALPDPTTPEGMRLVLQAATTALAELEVAKPKADAWDELASAEGDYEVGDAAKMLARAGLEVGRTRLFKYLAGIRWIYRGTHGKWCAYQSAVHAGYLVERPQWHFHPKTGDKVLDPPQIRVTARGLERLRSRMKANLAAVEGVAS